MLYTATYSPEDIRAALCAETESAELRRRRIGRMVMKRLTVTKPQGLLMIDVGLDQKLGVNVSRPMLLTANDCESILKALPYSSGRDGNEKRVTRALRARVIKHRAEMERYESGEGESECYQFGSLDDLLACAHDYQGQPRMLRFSLVTHTTPVSLAARMVEVARIQPMERVLEPSAGTGNLIAAIREVSKSAPITAVEINGSLAEGIRVRFDVPCVCGDFLEQNGNLGKFDAIVMNPPFVNGADIKHIEHAATLLKPGGRLVALCANGPRQKARLGALVDAHGGSWEGLPAGTFEQQGTSVNVALIEFEVTA